MLNRYQMIFVAGMLLAAAGIVHADALSVAQTALQDKLYPVAERHARQAVKSGNEAHREQARLILYEAIAEQGKHAELLKQIEADGTGDSEKPAFVYWRALALLETGDYAQAAQIAEAASKRPASPFTDSLLRLAARARLKTGETQAAWVIFSELDQRSTNATNRAANALEWAMSLDAAGKSDAAIEVLKLQADLPVRTDATDDGMLLRGRMLLKQGKQAEAVIVFNQLAMNDRASERARVQAIIEMSDYTWNGGKTNEAIAYARSAYSRATQPETRRLAGFRLGDLLVSTTNTLNEGSELIKQLVREYPESEASMRAQLKLADSFLQADRPQEAAAEYQIFLESYASSALDSRVLQGRGWALLRLNRATEAGAAFHRAAEMTTNRDEKAECLLKEGDALLAGKRYTDAADAYAKLAHAYPDHPFAPRALFQSADALERLGERDKAAAAYQSAAERYADRPEAPKALLRLAALRADAGDFDASIQTYSAVLASYNQQQTRMDAFMGRGMTYYRTYRFDAAMQDFASVVENDPGRRDEARFMLTLCLYWVGRDQDARVAATAFMTDFPESARLADMTLWLAKFDFNHGQYKEARRLFNSYATRWPSGRWADAALLWAARSAFFENDFTGCVEGVSHLVRTFPNSIRIPEATLLQVDALIELARFDEAVLLLNRIISQTPDNDWGAQAWLRKGDCLFTMGADNSHRYEEAINAYRTRLEKGNLSANALLQIHFKIGRCYEKLKQPDEAINEYYSEVMMRYQEERRNGNWVDDTSANLFLRAAFSAADLYERQDRIDQAIRILRRADRMDLPGQDEIKRRIERLKTKKAGT
ncbi:MAG: tetratricopeptide repeat protein [Kiritimatiellae bacterium]|nr:tetratricopeptide repeat protein [Kiritimatiellia bacterium]